MNANELPAEQLAQWCDEASQEYGNKPLVQVANMLRKQHAEIEALKEPKIPLLEQEIKFILGNGQCWQGEDCSMPNLMYIIRAVEVAHGIGVKQK